MHADVIGLVHDAASCFVQCLYYKTSHMMLLNSHQITWLHNNAANERVCRIYKAASGDSVLELMMLPPFHVLAKLAMCDLSRTKIGLESSCMEACLPRNKSL